MDLKEIVKNFDFETGDIETLKVKAEKGFDKYGIYPGSINRVGNAFVMMMRTDTEKKLVCLGDDDRLAGLDGTIVPLENCSAKVCSITNYNCRIIREIFPFMSPVVHKGKKVTIGLGDRLGLASPGHIRTVTDLDVFPVLAQQSIRELNLTGRTYDDVISAAAWAVFQQGYKKGYGADGDHLKTAEEVKMALDIGMTMITLDCSDHIDNDAANENALKNLQYSSLTIRYDGEYSRRYSSLCPTAGYPFFLYSRTNISSSSTGYRSSRSLQHCLNTSSFFSNPEMLPDTKFAVLTKNLFTVLMLIPVPRSLQRLSLHNPLPIFSYTTSSFRTEYPDLSSCSISSFKRRKLSSSLFIKWPPANSLWYISFTISRIPIRGYRL
jgi:hypothetical protein